MPWIKILQLQFEFISGAGCRFEKGIRGKSEYRVIHIHYFNLFICKRLHGRQVITTVHGYVQNFALNQTMLRIHFALMQGSSKINWTSINWCQLIDCAEFHLSINLLYSTQYQLIDCFQFQLSINWLLYVPISIDWLIHNQLIGSIILSSFTPL